jgi:cyclopropane-fatty-acyl-phospholipid synthase
MSSVARLFTKIFKEGGIILIDSDNQKYICGKPNMSKPITIRLLKKNLNWKLIINPDLSFPEAYMKGEIVIENANLTEFLNLVFKNIGRKEVTIPSYIIKKIMHLWRVVSNYNFPGKSQKDIQHHYDIGGEKGEKLYDIFLDEKYRQYSCAYFKNTDDTLEQAQQNKLDHIIKKLHIKEGQKILDIGCGWGGMAFEIARQKKCEVLGISLSNNQINYCNQKAKELNLDNQVRFELIDYRHVKGKFDRIVSVGMFEHIGKKFYKVFFKKINELLKKDGISLLHTIGSINQPQPTAPFIQKYIFPGGVVPSFSEILKPIEKTGLIVSDTETLIRHYDKTLNEWLKRFNAKKTEAKDIFDDQFVRMWEFYLASCSAVFKYRDLVVFQLQLVKNFDSIPSNRRDYIYS